MKKFCFLLFYKIILLSDVIVCGPVNLCDGIGRHAPEYYNFLSKKISNTRLYDSRLKIYPKHNFRKKTSDTNKKIFFFTGALKKNHQQIFEKMHQSDYIMISLTMVESTRAPASYVEMLNRYFDIAIVPDFFLKKVYEDSGVTIPIFIIPLMVDLASFLNSEPKINKKQPFVFGNFSRISPRKHQLLLVRAFSELFGNNSNYKLMINGRVSKSKGYLEEIKEYISKNKIQNIEITIKPLDTLAYIRNFKKIDAYVSLSKGEGFSIQPREAMALGIPCVVSNNTAQATICQSGLVVSVLSDQLVNIVDSYQEEYEDLGYQYDINLEEAKKGLQEVVSNYDHYLTLSSSARNWVKQFTFEGSNQETLLTIFNPKKIVFSNENRIENGIIYLNNINVLNKYNKIDL